MRVTIKLIASLQQGRFIEEECEYPVATTVGQVVAQLKISLDEMGMILINGRSSILDAMIQDGDTLSLFPLVGGG